MKNMGKNKRNEKGVQERFAAKGAVDLIAKLSNQEPAEESPPQTPPEDSE